MMYPSAYSNRRANLISVDAHDRDIDYFSRYSGEQHFSYRDLRFHGCDDQRLVGLLQIAGCLDSLVDLCKFP